MKFYFFAIIFLLMIINKIALAEEFPTFGKVYHKTENTMLDYSCKKIQPGKINCDFTQTSIWKNKKDELEREIETIKEKVGKEKFKASNVASPEQCELYKHSLAIVEGKKNKDTLKDSKIADSVENMMKTLKNSSSRQRQDFKKTLGLMADFCVNPDKENYINLLTSSIKKKYNTCRIFTNKFEISFKKFDDNWIADTSPQGTCGIVRLDRFEKEFMKLSAIPFWNYVSKKAITNPNGEFGVTKCDTLDETEYFHSWRIRDLDLECEYISFNSLN